MANVELGSEVPQVTSFSWDGDSAKALGESLQQYRKSDSGYILFSAFSVFVLALTQTVTTFRSEWPVAQILGGLTVVLCLLALALNVRNALSLRRVRAEALAVLLPEISAGLLNRYGLMLTGKQVRRLLSGKTLTGTRVGAPIKMELTGDSRVCILVTAG